MASKKKAVKMDLSTFLADDATGSWADETSDLPTMPAASLNEDILPGPSGGLVRPGRMPAMDDRPWRTSGGSRKYDRASSRDKMAPKPLPTEPPFTAYVGGLAFTWNEEDVRGLFMESDLAIASCRLPKDRETGQSKGFCYVEFETILDLENAIKFNGKRLDSGKILRVDVAESRKFDSPRSRTDDTRDYSQWRRDKPLAPQRAESQRSIPDRGGRVPAWGKGSDLSKRSYEPKAEPMKQERFPVPEGPWRRKEGQPAPPITKTKFGADRGRASSSSIGSEGSEKKSYSSSSSSLNNRNWRRTSDAPSRGGSRRPSKGPRKDENKVNESLRKLAELRLGKKTDETDA